MQKPLTTHQLAPYSLWRRLILFRKAGLLAGLTLLLLTGLTAPAEAANGFYRNFVTINGVKYYTIRGNDVFASPFPGITPGLGTFTRSQMLLINSAEANTNNDAGYEVRSTQLLYRVYLVDGNNNPVEPLDSLQYTSLQLPFEFQGNDNMPNAKNWLNADAQPDLLSATGGVPGRYVLELFFQGVLVNNTTSGSTTVTDILDDNGTNLYKTTFELTASTPLATWRGTTAGAASDWFTRTNWSTNQVPNDKTDVVIPFINQAAIDAGRRYPVISSATGLAASVRSLRLSGNNNRKGAELTLRTGELLIFGNFDDQFGGFSQSATSIFTLAGVTQSFYGATFSNVRIQGGGTKTLNDRMDVTNRLEFLGLGGVLVTRSDKISTFHVSLESGALIVGENENNYVLGILRTTKRPVEQGQTENFSGIGVQLKAEEGIPGGVLAIRTTGFAYEGPGTSKSIGRSFIFTPDNTQSLNFTLAFRYRQGDLNLNRNDENDLRLFGLLTGNSNFTNLGKTEIDTVANVLTRTYIQSRLGGTFTLGDQINPLPVTITSFTAAAEGADVVLSWATATEQNNRGFEVQESGDGKNFRTLGFVASESGNSSTPRRYQFRDTETGKQGTRYYRLRQVDLDGKQQFIGPKSVVFGLPTVASVQAYPNPFGPEINLSLQTVAGGQATVSMVDGVGRRVRTWQPTLAVGASTLQLPGLQALPHGLYVVEVRYSNGQTQRLKLVKE